ncbi:MAG: hypothetical protein H6983_23835 [Ectothiorhodospiraceae bacterium]|nr:hypothetical protein [Chromatiales bacterium]MCP5157229.1 hypothetical protein [Ectothiorhodospiraceae bacterium]
MTDEARLLLYDGQRVRREDLEFLRDALLDADRAARLAQGASGIAWGFRVTMPADGTVRVGPGLGWDPLGRPLVLDVERELALDLPATAGVVLCATYVPRVVDTVGGRPVRVTHDLALDFRSTEPEPGGAAVPVAEVRATMEGTEVVQPGRWYIPPAGAGFSGQFYTDAAGRWRYDGTAPAARLAPHFDSDWREVPGGAHVNVAHHLGTAELLVQLEVEVSAGTASNRGVGSRYWYETHGTTVVRLGNDGEEAARLRARLWRLDVPAAGPLAPVADAGSDRSVERGTSFVLDGAESIAFEGRRVVRYQWTRVD